MTKNQIVMLNQYSLWYFIEFSVKDPNYQENLSIVSFFEALLRISSGALVIQSKTYSILNLKPARVYANEMNSLITVK